MLSFWSKIFQSNEQEREHKRDLLQIEHRFLDQEPSNDNKENDNGNGLQMPDSGSGNENESDKLIGTSCSARKGVITFVTDQNGVIDKSIAFQRQAAGQLFTELTVGSVIEYLTYEQENGVSKVIKIQQIIDQSWEEATDNKVIPRPANISANANDNSLPGGGGARIPEARPARLL